MFTNSSRLEFDVAKRGGRCIERCGIGLEELSWEIDDCMMDLGNLSSFDCRVK